MARRRGDGWRGPNEPGEFPTLGYLVADFIEAYCAIPDGDHRGEAYLLTDEMVKFLLWFYRVDEVSGRFFFPRGGQLTRPQKWGKGPFASAIVCAEAQGPVLFDGWDAAGEPVGRPWSTPWIQVTAVSEDQTANVWRALQPMIELGSIAADIEDTGLTRINLPGGGLIEPVTASGTSRLGQRITFAPQDEPHSWLLRNGGRRLADTQRRNLAGMGGRFLETTNAWDPAQNSVAQQTHEGAAGGVYLDKSEAGPGSIRNKRERRRMLRKVYGDSHWVDLDRISAEVDALIDQGDPAQAERYYLNRISAEEGAAFDLVEWNGRARPLRVIPDGELIVIGVDGARYRDALAIVATDVVLGFQWPLGIWERPEDAADDYEHPADKIDGVMVDAFERFDVWRAYVDPQHIEHLTGVWAGRWNKGQAAEKQRVVAWWTNRPKPMAYAVRNYRESIKDDLTHDGDPTFTRHIGNARREELNVKDDDGRPMWGLTKEFKASPDKIDGAVGGVLSWRARGDAIAAGAKKARAFPMVY